MRRHLALLAATALIAAPAAAQRDGAAAPAGAQVLVDATPLLLDGPAAAADRAARRDPLPAPVVRRTADGATVTTIAVGAPLAPAGHEPRAAARPRRTPKTR